MDLLHHLQVMSRWKRVIIAGTLIGILLAALATFKPGAGGVTYRQAESWKATSTLFVTQPGFPWGRTTLPGSDPNQPETARSKDQSFADPARFSVLAVIYTYLAKSEQVDRLGRRLPEGSEVSAREIATASGDTLPLLALETTASTAAAAKALNAERTEALLRYLRDQQDQNKVPEGQRVQVSVLNGPEVAKVSSHGAMLAIAMVFLAFLASIGAAYLFENLRLARLDRERERATASHDDGFWHEGGGDGLDEPWSDDEHAASVGSPEPARRGSWPSAGRSAS